MRIIVSLTADRGTLSEVPITVECSKVEQDPMFHERVILHLASPLTFRHKGAPCPTKRWSVSKSDVTDWYQVDETEANRIARAAAEASMSRKTEPVIVAPVERADPEKPARAEVDEPDRDVSITVQGGGVLNLSMDLDAEES